MASFPPFSTLEDEESTNGYEIHDNGTDSPRVIGKVTDGAEKLSDGTETAEGTDIAESIAGSFEGNTERSGANPIVLVAGVASIATIGGIGFFMKRKRGK